MNRGQAEFARVYDDHVWRVYGFLAYRLRDRDVAEDLTQATFERALRAWSRFDPRRASELTWLLAIAAQPTDRSPPQGQIRSERANRRARAARRSRA